MKKAIPVATELDLGAMIQPVPAHAVFRDAAFNIWCGSAIRGDDRRYHLFYSRWPRTFGHPAWVTHSEIAHAVADNLFGPYRHAEVTLPARGAEFWDGLCTHNPTVLRANGKYYLYYTGNTGDGVVVKPLNWTHRNNQRIGVAVADRPAGPWHRFDQPVVDISSDPGASDALAVNNPSVCQRPDGGFLMVYKAVARQGAPPFGGPVVHLVATAEAPTGPFRKYPQPIFTRPGAPFAAEDPFLWRGADRYWAVVKDMHGLFTGRGCSLALFESRDGFDWNLAANPLVSSLAVTWANGHKQTLAALERPQVYLENGVPAALFCAAAESDDRDHSFNIQIPLRPLGPPPTVVPGTSATG